MSKYGPVPFEHRITVKRSTPTFNATTGAEVAGTEAIIYESIPALISPESVAMNFGEFGPIEQQENTIFLEAEDDNGNAYVIRQGDRLIDEDTEEVWIARRPKIRYQNPVLLSAGIKQSNHIQVVVDRADLESAGL